MNENFEMWISPELEARIVAWVAGEASPFEVAELERLLGEKPELGVFKRRMEAAHGLLGEAVKPDPSPLRLPEEKRAKLLATLAMSPGGVRPAVLSHAKAHRARWHRQLWMAAPAVAACLVVALVLSMQRTVENRKLKSLELPMATYHIAAQQKSVADAIRDNEDKKQFSVQFDSDVAAEPQVGLQSGSRMQNSAGSAYGQSEASGRGLGGQIEGRNAMNQGVPQFEVPAAKLEAPIEIRSGGAIAQPARPNPSDSMLSLSAVRPPVLQIEGLLAAGAGGRARGVPQDPEINQTVELSPFEVSAGMPQSTAVRSEGGKIDANFVATGGNITVVNGGSNLGDIRSAAAASTFSLRVSDVSFRLAREALQRGELPDAKAVRPEEFYNAFDYGDPAPGAGEAVSCRIEQSGHPYLPGQELARIGIRIGSSGRSAGKPLALTVLLDTSGSMEREDRATTVQRALQVLTSLLKRTDRITLIGFAREPHLLAAQVRGDQSGGLADLAKRTPAEGGTDLEAALALAAEQAQSHYAANAENRVIVLTDGAANLGDANPKDLAAQIAALRARGISFDACGIGIDGDEDALLSTLTREGGGRYTTLSSADQADAGFARQLAGAFHPAAVDVKVQVRFNPARVASYRLIGFDQDRLTPQDFRNDQVHAAQLAAGEAGVALYELQAKPDGEGEIGEVSVRFRDPGTGQTEERSWTPHYTAQIAAFRDAAASIQLAGLAATLAEKLQGGSRAAQIRLAELAPAMTAVQQADAGSARVRELGAMFNALRRIDRE